MPNLRALAIAVALTACTTHSQLQLARPGPNVEVRDGSCAEQRADRADQPIVDCHEYSTLSPVGGAAIVVAGLALASMMVLVGIRDIGDGLGRADDH